MKTLLSLLLFLLILFNKHNAQNNYSRAKICLNNHSVEELSSTGIPLDHIIKAENGCIVSDFSDYDLKLVANKGFDVEIIIDNVQEHYANQSSSTSSYVKTTDLGNNCSSSSPIILDSLYPTPNNFNLGSMGGYFTYDEFIGHLDNMHTLYPNLINLRQAIDTFQTYEGKPLYWVRISDNPNIDEEEPEVLYTSLHHAREPASLSQLIFYMYYLLENYDSDPKVKALVDHVEMYFVPMVNPDGYIYNETSAPNGGGMWRKNRRNNGNGEYGVDLNRNYGYEWGGEGSSGNPSSDTYRGPAPFSEPETKAIKFFTSTHDFKFALNYHTFSDLLLYPFGYTEDQPTPDDSYFKAFTPKMVSENDYANIISSGLYPAAGDSDDWMYGDSTKNKIFAMTPEVGGEDDGFWPSSDKILDLCKENVLANITLAELVLNYAVTRSHSHTIVSEHEVQFNFALQRLGLEETGNFVVSYIPISDNINAIDPQQDTFLDLDLEEMVFDSIVIDYNSENYIDTLSFQIRVDNSYYYNYETVHIMITPQSAEVIYLNEGETLNGWSTSSSWNITDEDYVSPSSSITDSPYSDYPNNNNSTLSLDTTIDLTDMSFAELHFWAKWDIESGYDYVQLQAFYQNTWYPLCGNYTNLGTSYQDENNPLYDGQQNDWVYETIPLNDFLGEEIELRFVFISDFFSNGDGFYFDDFEVTAAMTEPVSSHPYQNSFKATIYPNPNTGTFYIEGLANETQITLRNTLNQVVYSNTSNTMDHYSISLPRDLSKGTYILQLQQKNSVPYTQKIIFK